MRCPKRQRRRAVGSSMGGGSEAGPAAVATCKAAADPPGSSADHLLRLRFLAAAAAPAAPPASACGSAEASSAATPGPFCAPSPAGADSQRLRFRPTPGSAAVAATAADACATLSAGDAVEAGRTPSCFDSRRPPATAPAPSTVASSGAACPSAVETATTARLEPTAVGAAIAPAKAGVGTDATFGATLLSLRSSHLMYSRCNCLNGAHVAKSRQKLGYLPCSAAKSARLSYHDRILGCSWR